MKLTNNFSKSEFDSLKFISYIYNCRVVPTNIKNY